MAGLISNPHVAAPADPWSLWRDAITLANAGDAKLATTITEEILSDPATAPELRKMAEQRQRAGWQLPRPPKADHSLIPF